MRVLFDRVLDRMVEQGWLVSYTFTEGKGYWRNWCLAGSKRVEMLRIIVESLGLAGDDRIPIACYETAKGRDLPGATLYGSKDEYRLELDFFAACVDELGLSGADELLALVHVAMWD